MYWRPPAASSLSAEEVSAYIGHNAEAYKTAFERFTRTGTPRFAFSWNWPAFFCGVWWYLYRKMYLWAAVDFALSVFFGWTLFVPLLWAMARAVTGNYLYFRQADRTIREFRSNPPGGSAVDPANLARLAREGGVHRWIPWAAVIGVVLLLILSSLFFELVWRMVPPIHHRWPAPPGRWA